MADPRPGMTKPKPKDRERKATPLGPSGRPLTGAALTSHLTKTCPAPPPPKGNQRAATHGAASAQRLRPARERHVKALRTSYPKLDERRLVLLADRLARIEVASAWLDRQKGVVRNADGDIFQVVRDLDKWAGRAEALLKECEALERVPIRVDLAQEMSALEDEDDDE